MNINDEKIFSLLSWDYFINLNELELLSREFKEDYYSFTGKSYDTSDDKATNVTNKQNPSDNFSIQSGHEESDTQNGVSDKEEIIEKSLPWK